MNCLTKILPFGLFFELLKSEPVFRIGSSFLFHKKDQDRVVLIRCSGAAGPFIIVTRKKQRTSVTK